MNEVSMKTVGVSHLDVCIQCGMYGGPSPSTMDTVHAMIPKKVKHSDQPGAIAERAKQLKMRPRNGISRLPDERYTDASAN